MSEPRTLTDSEVAEVRAELDANDSLTMYGREWLDDLLATIAAGEAKLVLAIEQRNRYGEALAGEYGPIDYDPSDDNAAISAVNE